MFNDNEWSKILKALGCALGIGIGIDAVLFLWGIFAESFNCFCDMFGSSDTMPEMKESTLIYVIIVSLAIGLLIGIFVAISYRDERKTKEKSDIQSNNHKEILQLANSAWREAEKVKNDINTLINEACYYTDKKQNDINDIFKEIENEQEILFESLEKYKVD